MSREHPRAAEIAGKMKMCANRDDAEDLVCAALVAAGMGRVAEAWLGPDRVHAGEDDSYVSPILKASTAMRTVDAYGRPTSRRP